jgi:hypothetical protein
MASSGIGAGPACPASPAAQSGSSQSSATRPGASGANPQVTDNDRHPARPARRQPLASPQPPRGSGAATSPHRELFLLLGSTPLKVVVVVMAPRSEVGWRGYRMLKGKDPRDAETFRPQPATAAGTTATACQPAGRFYWALNPRPYAIGIG